MHIRFPKHSVQITVKAACALARVCCDRRLIENEIQYSGACPTLPVEARPLDLLACQRQSGVG